MFITKIKIANLITYLGIIFSIFAIYISYKGNIISDEHVKNIHIAYICFMLSGICDLFDGMFARKFKRTEKEKDIGIQLDSLADVLNFLIVPVVISISQGMDNWFNFIIYGIYVVLGITRLAFFNVYAKEKKGTELKIYKGVAVTYSSFIFPMLYLIFHSLDKTIFYIIYMIGMLCLAFLFVLNINIKKPGKKGYIIWALIAIIMISLFILI